MRELICWPLETVQYKEVSDFMLNKSFNLPQTFQSVTTIDNKQQFDSWKTDMIKRFGADGKLSYFSYNNFHIEENLEWKKYVKDGAEAIARFYSSISGDTGD